MNDGVPFYSLILDIDHQNDDDKSCFYYSFSLSSPHFNWSMIVFKFPKFWTKITNYLTVKSIWLVAWAIIWRHRKAVKTGPAIQNNISSIAITRIRSTFELPMSGIDASLDEQISDAHKFFIGGGGPFATVPESLSQYVSWLEDDSPSLEDRETYLRIAHLMAQGPRDRNSTNERYKSLYEKNIDPIYVFSGFSEIASLLKRRAKSEKSSLNDRKANRIDLHIKVFPYILPLFSVLLLSGGYIYSTTLYGHFGIDTSSFFSINDYLASSINTIEHTLIVLLVGIIGNMSAYRNWNISKTDAVGRSQQTTKPTFRFFIFRLFSWLFSWLLVIASFFVLFLLDDMAPETVECIHEMKLYYCYENDIVVYRYNTNNT